MTAAERARFGALPDRVEVFRGFGTPAGRRGIAWTLDRDRATWFAEFAVSPRMAWLGTKATGAWVAHTTVKRDRIIALFDEREENEVLIPSLRGYRLHVDRVEDPPC